VENTDLFHFIHVCNIYIRNIKIVYGYALDGVATAIGEVWISGYMAFS
jgi:hypothetical protein